jgi:hypothetical protein
MKKGFTLIMKKGFTLIFADLSAEFRGFLASKNQRESPKESEHSRRVRFLSAQICEKKI